MGTTASGKTEVAADLSRVLPIELVSVDAVQVYRGMNIGAAKPTAGFLEKYPHHLIDICDLEKTYSAADFVNDCAQLIAAIHARGNLPLLVGGAMFYFNALQTGLSRLPAANPLLRQQIVLELEQNGVPAMHRRLHQIDPLTAARIAPNDRQRIQRAIEIYRQTGQLPSSFMHSASGITQPLIKMALFNPARSVLHAQIARRFQSMLEQGLVREVETLRAAIDNPAKLPAMRAVGYRQVLDFLEQRICRAEMIDRAVAATRQLAKRQLTWMRQQSNLVWFANTDAQKTATIATFLRAHHLFPSARQ